MDRLVGPRGEAIAGPELARAQAAAIRQEVMLGRTALQALGVLLSEMGGRKTTITPARYAKFAKAYPGAFVRFGETDRGMTLRLLTPEEAAAETQEPGADAPAEGDAGGA